METNWNQVLGHGQQKAELRTMLREERLPHALLFSGPEGVGKKMLAHVLATTLLCGQGESACGSCSSCRLMRLGDSHPDYYELMPEKRGKGQAVIRIEQIRELQREASRAPVMSGRRVLLIDDADRMNEAAANSLLKTLEEPVGNVTFILVTSARSALLDTILSRCMPFSFGMLSREHIAQILQARGAVETEALELADLADGSAARALQLQAEDGLQLRDEALQFLRERQDMDMMRVWQLAAAWGEMDKDKLTQWSRYLNMLLRDLLVLREDGASPLLLQQDKRAELMELLPAYPAARLYRLLALVHAWQRRLQSNASPKLQAEGFLIRAREV